MRVLRKVASTGRTIICTIHQPSAEVFFNFDNLLLLLPGGITAYFGELGYHAAKMVRYFGGLPNVAPLPLHVNPATWMLETLASAPTRGVEATASSTAASTVSADVEAAVPPSTVPVDFFSAYAASAMAADAETIVKRVIDTTSGSVKHAGEQSNASDETVELGSAWIEASKRPVGYGTQLSIVTTRAIRVLWRESEYGGNRIIGAIALALFYGLLFLVLDDSYAGVQSRMGAILAGPGFLGLVMFTTAIPLYVRMRPVFYRETAARMYAPTVYAIAIMTAELPWMLGISTVWTLIFYFMAHFVIDAGKFFFFLLMVVVCAFSFFYAGIAASNLVPSPILAQIGGGVFLAMVWLFAYVFLPYGMIPEVRCTWGCLACAVMQVVNVAMTVACSEHWR